MNYQSYADDSVSLDQASPFLDDHLARYIWNQNEVKGGDILDCACGKGYGSYLMSLSAKSVVGVDMNENSLEIARSRFLSLIHI